MICTKTQLHTFLKKCKAVETRKWRRLISGANLFSFFPPCKIGFITSFSIMTITYAEIKYKNIIEHILFDLGTIVIVLILIKRCFYVMSPVYGGINQVSIANSFW